MGFGQNGTKELPTKQTQQQQKHQQQQQHRTIQQNQGYTGLPYMQGLCEY